MTDDTNGSEHMRELALRIRKAEQQQYNLPSYPCGSTIKFRQSNSRGDETFGEFLFSAEKVADILTAKIKASRYPNKGEKTLLKWARQRNSSITEPVVVPKYWWWFDGIADDLIRQGAATTKCLKCGINVLPSGLTQDDEKGLTMGWLHNRLVCPEGHELLVVETVHIMPRQSDLQ